MIPSLVVTALAVDKQYNSTATRRRYFWSVGIASALASFLKLRESMKIHLSNLLLLVVIVALAVGWSLDRSQRRKGVALPDDPLLKAIEHRLGRPDAVSGSGRTFLHYDLESGERVTLIVSGNRLLGVEQMRTGK